MPKTITSVGIEKIGRRFADSIDHAAYTLNGAPKTVEPFRKLVTADTVKIYSMLRRGAPYSDSSSGGFFASSAISENRAVTRP